MESEFCRDGGEVIKLLKEHGRFKETLFMGSIAMLCFSFSVFRYFYTDTRIFLFLNWNLFLAFMPWALSSLAILHPKLQNSRITMIGLLFTWLLFFPNAPYILTDLFHLRARSTMPVWFDLILILSFAWTGLLFGFLSLWDIEKILKKSINNTWIPVISASLLFIGSFGIYVGRYLRWNSWDVIREPFGLVSDIGEKFLNPFEYPKAWGLTMFMGLFLNIIYWSLRLIKKRID
jgi:uncharacterized membrane protein